VNRNTTPNDNLISEKLQKTLDGIAARMSDRKDELVDILNGEQPSKSHMVEAQYAQCVWWEGCYYCQDDNQQWHRVKCFM
jgi:hypothetical protein